MANLGLDTTQYERTTPQGGPLPPSVYTMTVVRIQQKETNDKQGVYEEVEFDVSSPAQFSNRKFWDRFNIINKSAKAQQIGREAIADLAKACGINGMLNDDQELLGRTVQARLYVQPQKEWTDKNGVLHPAGELKNECRKYYPVGVDADAEDEDARKKGGQPAAQSATSAAKPNWNNAGVQVAAQSAPSPSTTPPWKN